VSVQIYTQCNDLFTAARSDKTAAPKKSRSSFVGLAADLPLLASVGMRLGFSNYVALVKKL
jgi:hypothetical protein